MLLMDFSSAALAASAPHVELATDAMGDNASNASIQLLRSFQDRLNRRIEKASKTLQGGLFRPEGTDPVYSSSSEASTREQTPSVAGATSSSREVTPSSREVTPSQGSESVGASSYESEDAAAAAVAEAGEGEESAACRRGGGGEEEVEGGGDSVNGVEGDARGSRGGVDEKDESTATRDDSQRSSVDDLSAQVDSALNISQNSTKEKEASPVPSVGSQNSTSAKRCSQPVVAEEEGEETVAVNGSSNGAVPNSETDV